MKEFKKAFVGWTIYEISMSDVKEGGLTFHLSKPDGMTRKVILGYTELGEWIESVEDEKSKSVNS